MDAETKQKIIDFVAGLEGVDEISDLFKWLKIE